MLNNTEQQTEYMKTDGGGPNRVIFRIYVDGREAFQSLDPNGWTPFTPSTEERLIARQLLKDSTTTAPFLPVGSHVTIWGAGKLTICWVRSEERRVGKECRSRWSPYH